MIEWIWADLPVPVQKKLYYIEEQFHDGIVSLGGRTASNFRRFSNALFLDVKISLDYEPFTGAVVWHPTEAVGTT